MQHRRSRRSRSRALHLSLIWVWISIVSIQVGCDSTDRSATVVQAVSAGPSAASLEIEPGDRPPNVVLIIADDLGSGSLGSYGQQQIKTPRLDALAAEGLRFTSFHAGGDSCSASRATLMSGSHAGHAYIRDNLDLPGAGQQPLRADSVTLAKILKEAGYATAMIGKWGLGDAGSDGDPGRQGFDHTFGYLNQVLAHNSYPEFLWRNGEKVPLRNVATYVDVKPEFGGLGSYSTTKVDFAADFITEEAESFITQNAERPFFLYLAYTAPHTNGDAPVGLQVEVPTLGDYSSLGWNDDHKAYAALVTRLDSDVGRILDHLESLGLDDETLVLFTADNGAAVDPITDFFVANDGLRGGKFGLYQGGLVVPMIARWPGRIAAGTTSDLPAALFDLFPTLAEVADVENIPPTDGVSLVPTLLGSTQPARRAPLYWESQTEGGAIGIRDGRWKGIYFAELNLFELYDLETDPGETWDLAAERPEIVASLLERMREEHAPSEIFPVLPSERSGYHRFRRFARRISRGSWSPDLWPDSPD